MILRKCVAEAGLQLSDVDTLLIVGGGAMIPVVKARLTGLLSESNQQVLYHDPAKAVALGAALHCSQVTGAPGAVDLPAAFRGVTGYHVGIRTIDVNTGRIAIDRVIPKNVTLPASAKKTYYTTRPDQDRIVIEIVQFRESGADDTIGLGQLVVGPLREPKLNYPIEVSIECKEDGTIEVSASDTATGAEIQHSFAREEDTYIARLATQRALIRSMSLNLT